MMEENDDDPVRFGKYRLTKKIATGGMAEIFLAELEGATDPKPRSVVVKRILPNLSETEGFISMFLDEARIAAGLQHPNIVSIEDIGQVGGHYYLAMEYIHGEDIRGIYNQAYRLQRSLPLPCSIHIIAQAARGLDHAHRATDLAGRSMGLVHRDVSPQNILVSFDGVAKVVDFGIAKAVNKVAQTRVGVLKGKYSYMSPEQAKGETIDHRTDLFALGIILYEVTTGTRLFKRATELATLQAIIQGAFKPPSEVLSGYPAELETIVVKALAPSRERRFQSGAAFADRLEDFLRSAKIEPSTVMVADFMRDLFRQRWLGAAASDAFIGEENTPEATVLSEPGEACTRSEARPNPHLSLNTQASAAPQSDAMDTVALHPAYLPDAAARPSSEAGTSTGWVRPQVTKPPARAVVRHEPTERVRKRRPEPSWGVWTKLGAVVGLGLLLGLAVIGAGGTWAQKAGGERVEGAELVLFTESGAEIWLGDTLLGLADEKGRGGPFPVQAGSHAVRVRSPSVGFERERVVELRAGLVFESEMYARTGSLEIRVAPWAHVFVDDKLYGTTPLPPIQLVEGRHSVRLHNGDLGVEKILTETIEPGAHKRLQVKLR